MPKYLLGVDLGTSGTKTAVFSCDGEMIADAYEESRLVFAEPGSVEQNPEDFYTSSVNTIARALASSGVSAGDVAAIALTGQMAGILGIDADWNPVTPYDSWLDTRCKDYVEALRRDYRDLLVEATGMPPAISHLPKMLWWKNERPDVHRRVAKYVVPAAYVAGRLAGLKVHAAFIDYTYLHWTGLCDLRGNRWSPELMSAFGLQEELLPRIVEPWAVVGHLTREAADASGLLAGTAIVAGAGDQAANWLGAGMTQVGQVVDASGTSNNFSCCTDRFSVPDDKGQALIVARSVLPGRWVPHAYLGGGLDLRWFRDEFAGEERQEALEAGRDAYEILNSMAESVPPGAAGVLFVPHLGGRLFPFDAGMRGMWVGFSWSHGRAHFYRAILESVAYEYWGFMNLIRSLHQDIAFSRVTSIGGGARSDLWCQIKADVLGMPVVRLNREEFGVLGAAVVAGYGIGLFNDLGATATALSQPVRLFEPDPRRTAIYGAYLRAYLAQYEHSGRIFELVAASRDCAAGVGAEPGK